MKSLFIVNPRSGVRRREDIRATIRSGCNAPFDITQCDDTAALDQIIADAERSSFEVIYAVGGDGTVHEIARRLMRTSLALGIIPAGSGNGLARHLGIPTSPREALTACGDGVVATIDTAAVNGLPYFGVMGVGLDAVIAERFALSKVRGLRTYLRVGLRTYVTFRPDEYEITIDGDVQKRRAFVLAIANSSQYGNNARIAPLASLQDGLLDIVIIDRASIFSAPLMLARLFNGSFDRASGVRILQGREVNVHRPAAGPAHIDGEPITLPADLSVRIVPSSLRVLLPRGSARI